MTKDEFLHRFHLQPLASSTHSYQHHSELKNAAVLIGLVDDGTQLNVLLTKRALHLRHHGGQISFPGGRAEPSDADLSVTAIRETFEEVGIHRDNIQVIGQLNNYQTISGFDVTPYVAFIKTDTRYTCDENEVSEVFHVPLSHFLSEENHLHLDVSLKGKYHKLTFIPYQHHNIWGATAAMLKDLVHHLQ